MPVSRLVVQLGAPLIRRLHASHHFPFCSVQLSLLSLARFFEVLMSTQVSENSSLLALLLEPAKGTLEGLAFFDPDAGHLGNRLLTIG